MLVSGIVGRLFLVVLLPLHAVVSAATATDNTSTVAAEEDFSVEPSPPGGLRWHDLEVTTAAATSEDFRQRASFPCIIDSNSDDRYDYYNDGVARLLHPTTGFVKAGSVCGIIGPSGSGKSTFLAALGGTTPRGAGLHLSGSVWYEEEDEQKEEEIIVPDVDKRRRRLSPKDGDIAMLAQHDSFFAMLTPRETLELSGRFLRWGATGGRRNTNDEEKLEEVEEEVEQILASLGISGGIAERRIGDRTAPGSGGGGGGFGIGGIGRKLRRRRWDITKDETLSCGGSDSGGAEKKKRRAETKRSNGGGGGLSGGERRRLSLAMELISEPKVFLADEPTTGLDSSQAEKVVKLISKLARERNIPALCSMHQPKASIWKILDSFVLLAPGGKVIYSGDRAAAAGYFQGLGYECPPETNPAEYYIDLVTIDTEDPAQGTADSARIDFLHSGFLESCKQNTASSSLSAKEVAISWVPPSSSSLKKVRSSAKDGAHVVRRFAALLRRSWRQNTRNVPLNVLRLGASVVQAGLFATIFKSVRHDKPIAKSVADRIALLSFGVINMSMMSLMKTLDLFAKERSVVMRERTRNQYTSFEYLMSKTIAEMPLDAFFAVVFALMLKRLTGLRSSLGSLIGTFSLMTLTTTSLGFAIGSIASTVESSMSMGVPVMVVLMILGIINPSGVNPDEPPNALIRFLARASPIKWAVEALVVEEFQNWDFAEISQKGAEEMGGHFEAVTSWKRNLEFLKDLPRMGALAMVRNGDEVLYNLGLAGATYTDRMSSMMLLAGGYLVLSWFGLSFCGPKFIETTDAADVRVDSFPDQVTNSMKEEM